MATVENVTSRAPVSVELLDPCIDSTLAKITMQSLPMSYAYRATMAALEVALDFSVVHSPPNVFGVCGPIETTATAVSTADAGASVLDVNASSAPISYDSAAGTLRVYEANPQKTNTYTVTILAKLANYSALLNSEVFEFVIDILVSPCYDPVMASITAPVNPPDQHFKTTRTPVDVYHEEFGVTYDSSVPEDFCGAIESYGVQCLAEILPAPCFDLTQNLAIDSVPTSYDAVSRHINVFTDLEDYIGEYTITIVSRFVAYPDSPVANTIFFKLLITEIPCKNPVSISASTLVDQRYIITDDTLHYQVEPFVTVPDDCIITYDFQSSPPPGSGVFNFDPVAGSFSFYADDDLSLSDRKYNIQVSATIGSSTRFKWTNANFFLTVVNPCELPDFLYIIEQELPTGLEYVLFYSTLSFTHDAFTVYNTKGFDIGNLCGVPSYTAIYDSTFLGPNTAPVSYDGAKRQFGLYSEDPLLIPRITVEVFAYISTNPSIVSATVSTQIEIIDPCIAHHSLVLPV